MSLISVSQPIIDDLQRVIDCPSDMYNSIINHYILKEGMNLQEIEIMFSDKLNLDTEYIRDENQFEVSSNEYTDHDNLTEILNDTFENDVNENLSFIDRSPNFEEIVDRNIITISHREGSPAYFENCPICMENNTDCYLKNYLQIS